MKTILETKRLIIREMNLDDFDSLKKVLSDPVNMKYYPEPYDDNGVSRWIKWCMDSYKKNGFGLWAVVLKETGEMIGDCGISIQNIDNELKPEIGYHLRLDYHRQGLGHEMTSAVKDYFFLNYNYDEVFSYMNINNIPSEKTAIKNGMKFIKTFESSNGEIDKVYRITRSEWKLQMNDNIINSIEYKKYNSSYEKEVIDIFVEAFKNYPLFEIVKNDFKTEEKYNSFYNSFMRSLFKATIRKNECYIGIYNDNVINLVIIDAPTDRPVGFLDYIFTGGIKPILKLGLFNALKFLKLSDETEIVVKSIKEPRWHLYFLVVEPNHQGKGVGSDAIKNFLIPFVKEKNGKLITVTTNAKDNIKFYTNNGFSLIKEETLKYKNRTVDNWSFRMDL